ncbi:hypothetical protein OV090_09790 [Nannocystis sp. RBIL2]|uniref:hypothetical protein n=1 Tax=Nannocystis sp. RBIL2 TaxID=2996788 RepID=UPI00226D98CC|nr:hypothetical protein [Nannocystis sp. RBIL2]MCY1065052.1 hypothetical protein [Nannocystis sp. RBIL2]
MLLAAAACGDDAQIPGATDPATSESGSTVGDPTGNQPTGTTAGDDSTTTADTTVPTSTSTADTGTDSTSPLTSTSNETATSSTSTSTSTSTGETTEDGTSTSTGATDTTDGETGETGVDPCGPDSEGPLLNCFVGCPDELFAVPPYVEEFDAQAQYDAHWGGTWAAPTLAGGALNFGPHPMTMDWWDNYSPTWSKQEYGDALLCVRLRLTPPMVGIPDEDMFEITSRLPADAAFETGAMALGLLTADEQVVFRTRIAEAQWQEHAEAPLPLDRGVENTLDVLIYSQGDDYVAELRNAAHPDDITVLPATAQFSPKGLVTLLGWRNSEAVHVDRLVLGAPSADAYPKLAAELP